MKLTIKDLVLFYNLYDQIKDRAPSIKTAYKMNKIYERAAQEQTFIQEQQQKIAEKYDTQRYIFFSYIYNKIIVDIFLWLIYNIIKDKKYILSKN